MAQNWTDWLDWTPVLSAATTPPTLSTDNTHLAEGRYRVDGTTVFFRGQIKAGVTGVDAGSGRYRLVLPVTAYVPANANLGGATIGRGSYFDASGGVNKLMGIATGTESSSGLYATFALDATGSGISVDHDTPWALAASDEFEFWGFYEAATS